MFLLSKPIFSDDNNEETNDNIMLDDIIPIGNFELPMSIDENKFIEFGIKSPEELPKRSFNFSIYEVNKLLVTEITNDKKIKFAVSLASANTAYTLFVPQRLDFLSTDNTIQKHVGIYKYPYIQNRYVLSVSLYVKKDKLEYIYNGISSNQAQFIKLKDIFIYAITYTNNNPFDLKVNSIKNINYGIFKTTKDYKVKPFNYQLENVNWCKNIEKNIDENKDVLIINGFEKNLNIDKYFLMNDNVLYLYGKNVISNPEHLHIPKYIFRPQGGLLCDNTGLGKTFTLAIHITDDNTKINDLCTKRANMLINYRNELLVNPNKFNYIGYKVNMQDVLNVIDEEYKLIYGNYKLKTNCNLLIVPVRLVQQWESEIKKYLPLAKIYVINTVRDYYKLDLEKIENYELIIVPITFIQNNKRLIHDFDLTDIFWKRVIIDEVHELFNPEANSRRNNEYVNKLKSFYKWGISATPTLVLNKIGSIFGFLSNNNYWENDSLAVGQSRYYNKVTTNVKDFWRFVNSYYRYNEQTKVKEEVVIPDYEEQIIELEMSNIEKLLYNNATGDEKRMLALCTNYKISNHDSDFTGFTTVSDLKNKMKTQHNKKRQEHLDKIELEKKNIGYIKEVIDWFYGDRTNLPDYIKINYPIITGDYDSYILYTQDVNKIADAIEKLTKKLDTKEKHIQGLEKELKLIEAKEEMIDKFDNMIKEKLNEPCMICFGNFDTVMITSCNHMYCGNCVNELFKHGPNIKCPMCRTNLTRGEINTVVDKNLNVISGDDMKKKIETLEKKQENKQENNENNQDSEKNLNTESSDDDKVEIKNGGTKISEIIKYVKECKGKIIIFAENKVTLDLIGEIFDENHVSYVNLKGNTYVISKQLKKFKTGAEKVILLSADRANSGTNLIEASHIILLDTHLIKDVKLKKDIEKQAIGRAVRLGQKNVVKVLRFIMKNTIEQVYLNKHM